MLKRFARAILRTLWQRAGMIFAGLLTVVILGTGVRSYLELGVESPFPDKAAVVELTITALGLLSIVLLVIQLRQTAAFNRTLSYHQFFHEIPSAAKVRAVRECLARLEIPPPTMFRPLSKEQSSKILADEGVMTEGGYALSANYVIGKYLDDYEEMCAAINVGLVSDKYVREIEGTRIMNAYFGYEKLIATIMVRFNAQATEAARASKELPLIHSKAYLELKKVAIRWKKRRVAERQKRDAFAEKLHRFRGRLDRILTGDDDGVSPE